MFSQMFKRVNNIVRRVQQFYLSFPLNPIDIFSFVRGACEGLYLGFAVGDAISMV